MEKITRKEFLSNSKKLAIGVAAGVAGFGAINGKDAQGNPRTYSWPFPYAKLDPEVARIAAHDLFWGGKACCAGTFGGVLSQLQEVVGEPFTSIPMELMIFGHGGGVGWGATCGVLNGAAAAISMVHEKAVSDVLNNEMFAWYCQHEFPSAESNDYAVNHIFADNRCDIELPRNMSGSPLCHASITEWSIAAGFGVSSLERKERCARAAGDAAAKTVELLNAQFDNAFTSEFQPHESVAACMSCHGAGFVDNVTSKMTCTQCHGDPHKTTSVDQFETTASSFTLEQNYPNPFNPHTTVQFSLPHMETVDVAVYDIRGRLVRTLVDHQTYSAGSYNMTWDGRDNFGRKVVSGVYFTRMTAGQFSQTKKMTMVK